jgi:signal peptidase I
MGLYRGWRPKLRDGALAMVLGLVALGGFAVYYTERYSIASPSMEPTLAVGEDVWAVRRYETPRRGQIVAFVHDGTILIKRVVGLPGEQIEAIDGQLMVSMAPLNESVWIDEPLPTGDFGPIELGENEYFLLGDNRPESIDSRHFGPITGDRLSYIVLGH